MDHVFELNKQYMVGSFSITGTSEGVLAGTPDTILNERLKELASWEDEDDSRFFYRGGALTEIGVLPKFICKLLIISRDYKIMEVSYFSNLSLTELPSEICAFVETKEFGAIFKEKSFDYI